MTLDEQAQIWRNANEEAIKHIAQLVYGPKEDYEQEFQQLALAITNTDMNPWSFMPEGWEGVLGSAQRYESFLTMVHHAMCDDGDISFVEHQMHGSCIVMHNHHDTVLIADQMKKRYPSRPGMEYTYIVHTDVYKFIKGLQEK